jgi:hypothetical protein
MPDDHIGWIEDWVGGKRRKSSRLCKLESTKTMDGERPTIWMEPEDELNNWWEE